MASRAFRPLLAAFVAVDAGAVELETVEGVFKRDPGTLVFAVQGVAGAATLHVSVMTSSAGVGVAFMGFVWEADRLHAMRARCLNPA